MSISEAGQSDVVVFYHGEGSRLGMFTYTRGGFPYIPCGMDINGDETLKDTEAEKRDEDND